VPFVLKYSEAGNYLGNTNNSSMARKDQGYDNQSFVNSNNIPPQSNQSPAFGNNSFPSNRGPRGWSNSQNQSDNSYNQTNNPMLNQNQNNFSNNMSSMPRSQFNNSQGSTSMKIMQAVGPKYAAARGAGGGFSGHPSDNNSFSSGMDAGGPRPSFRSFPPRGSVSTSQYSGRKRERSRSRSPIRDRSNSSERQFRGGRRGGRRPTGGRFSNRDSSPPPLKRATVSRSPPRTSATRTSTALSPSPNVPTSLSATATAHHHSSKGEKGGFEISTLTPKECIEEYQLPAIYKSLNSLSIADLNAKFPKLYIPADFTDLKLDWQSIAFSTAYDFFFNISASVPLVFENTPTTLANTFTWSSSEENTNPDANNSGEHQHERKCYSDILEPAKYTYLSSQVVNNTLTDHPQFSDRFINSEKPVKFNAKVLVCCGLKDPENERIDHNFTKKIRFVPSLNIPYSKIVSSYYNQKTIFFFCYKNRVLCGRRKGNLLLLGTSWSEELDGGDPRVDRSCLLNTARRALLAQSLLDIAKGTPDMNLVKMCEICYHRPKEEIKGRIYPEQVRQNKKNVSFAE
jgi:hypothetical protein